MAETVASCVPSAYGIAEQLYKDYKGRDDNRAAFAKYDTAPPPNAACTSVTCMRRLLHPVICHIVASVHTVVVWIQAVCYFFFCDQYEH